jgi:hypothetical protein
VDAPLRVRDVLDVLVDLTGGKAAAAGVMLVVEIDAQLQAGRLRGDSGKLRQALLNIIGAQGMAPRPRQY